MFYIFHGLPHHGPSNVQARSNPHGTQVRNGCSVTSLDRGGSEGAWRLRVETEEGQEELLASFVIVATGVWDGTC